MAVNWWKRTLTKLLFFQYSHFKQANPHTGSLLVLVFGVLSTSMCKPPGVEKDEALLKVNCGLL